MIKTADSNNIIFTIGSKLAPSFSANMTAISNQITATSNKFNKIKLDISQFKNLKMSIEADKKEMAELQKETNTITIELKNTKNPSKELTASFEANKNRLAELKNNINQNNISLNSYRKNLKSAGINTKNLSEENIRLKKEMEASAKASSKMAKLQEIYNSGKEQKKKGSTQIKKYVEIAVEDNSAFENLENSLNNIGVNALETKSKLLQATSTIPVQSGEIYNLASAALNAGVAQNKLSEFTAKSAKMAVAFGVSSKDMANIMNGSAVEGEYSKETLEALSNAWNHLNNNHDSELGADVLSQYASNCSSAEYGTNILNKAKQNLAITAGNALLPAIQTGTNLVNSASVKLAEFASKHTSLTKYVSYLFGAMAGLNYVIGTSKMLFGNLASSGARLIKFFCAKTVAVGANTTATEANTVAENTQNITQFKSIMLTSKNIAMNTAQRASTLARTAAEKILTAVNSKSSLVTAKNIAINGAYRLSTLAGAAATAVMSGAMTLFNTIMAANPIGIVVVAIAGLIGGLVCAYKHFEKFRNFLKSIGEMAKKLFSVFKIFNKDKKVKQEVELNTKNNIKNNANSHKNNLPTGTIDKDKLEKFAKGGMVTKPTIAMIGEGGDNEMVIPLNSSERSKSLWEKAGNIIGMGSGEQAVGGSTGGGNSSAGNSGYGKSNSALVIEKIEINLGDKKGSDIEKSLSNGTDNMILKLEELANKMLMKEKRLSYG